MPTPGCVRTASPPYPGPGHRVPARTAFCGWLSVAFFGVLFAGLAAVIGISLTLTTPARGGWLTVGALLAAALACALISAIAGTIA